MKTDPDRLDRWAPWLAAAGALGLGFWIWEWFPPGIWHDDGVYVLLGRALARGEGLRYIGVAGSFPAPKFPPLFPLALALIWRVAPEFPANATFLNAANLLFLAASAGVFVAFVRKTFQVPLGWTLAVAALVWISPALWRVAMVPLSEPLFILLFLLALWAGARLEQGGGPRAMALFLVLAGAAFFTRTVGIVLIPGSSLALLRRGRKRDGVTVLLLGMALVLPWLLWARGAAAAIPGPLLDTLGPYGTWLSGMISRDPAYFLSFLPPSAIQLLGRVLSLLLPGVAGPILWVGLGLLPVLVLGLWRLGKQSLTVLLTAAIYAFLLLLWPFQDVRLVVPLLPLLMLGTVVGFRAVLFSGSRPGGGRIPAVLLAASWGVLVVGFSGVRLISGWPGDAYRIRSEALVQAVRVIREKTPSDAVVGAPELWSGIHLFTGRTVSPSARFLPLSREGPSWGTPREQYRLWTAAGITHLLVEHGGRVHGQALDRVDAECPPGTVQLLDPGPGQFLVRLNWDQACRDRVLVDD